MIFWIALQQTVVTKNDHFDPKITILAKNKRFFIKTTNFDPKIAFFGLYGIPGVEFYDYDDPK